MATKVQLINGNFQDSEGNVLANGYLMFELSQDEQVSGTGQICAGTQVKVTLDANGNVAGTQSVWGNDVMLPANSYYNVSGYSSNGQLAWGPNAQQVTGGPTFDLNTWIPNYLPNFSPSTTSPTLQTNGVNNAVQSKLNLVAGSNVTLAADSTGDVTVSATAASSLQLAQSFHQILVNQAPGVPATGSWPLFTSVTRVANSETVIAATSTAPVLYQGSTNGAANQQAALLYETNSLMTRGIFGTWKSKVGITAISNVNFWLGITDTIPTGTGSNYNTATPAANVIGFRLSAGDANWKCVCQTGAASQTIVDSLVAADTNLHVFSIQQPSAGTFKFYIDGALVATISTNVPAISTALQSFVCYINTAIGAVTLNFSSIYWDSGF